MLKLLESGKDKWFDRLVLKLEKCSDESDGCRRCSIMLKCRDSFDCLPHSLTGRDYSVYTSVFARYRAEKYPPLKKDS